MSVLAPTLVVALSWSCVVSRLFHASCTCSTLYKHVHFDLANEAKDQEREAGRWVVGLCMSSYFQCSVNGQGGLLCFPFLNYCYHSFKFWAPCSVFFFFCPTQSLQYNMRMILCCGGGQWPEHSHSQLVKERSLFHLGSW